MMRRATALAAMLAGGLAVVSASPSRQPERVPARPSDHRTGALRDLDGVFPFAPSETREAWSERAAELRRHLQVALGLWPWPTRTPLNAVVHGKVSRDGYTVERVVFESIPGQFVTGSLYRPAGRTGRLPAILSPHGHWPGGRFQDVPEAERRKELASGAERFDNAARHILQARSVQLARMGAIVFLYDMIGYADSVQFPIDLVHGGKRARALTSADAGLLYTPRADANLHSVLGLQIWGGLRALDFLTSLPDVDPARIGITGASGGGTQTFLIAALDPRPAVAFPAVMVSTRMQGGCTCENADYLRIGTGNVEIAALFAPRPLGMTAADDWTKTMPEAGFPELKRHYALLGAPDNVMLFPFLQFEHNYNHVSRVAMYGWFNRHFHLGFEEPVLEADFVPLTRDEATVWTSDHPAPAGGEAHERAVLSWWSRDTAAQLAALPGDATSLQSWRGVVGGALDAIIGRRMPDAGEITVAADTTSANGLQQRRGFLIWAKRDEAVPFLQLDALTPRGDVVVWLSGKGTSGLFGPDGKPRAGVQTLLDRGMRVIGLDLFGTGEDTQRLVENRKSAAFTFGYNPPLIVERVHDVLAALAYARSQAGPAHRVLLAGLGRSEAAWAALARAQAGAIVDAAAIETGGFRFADVASMSDPALLPGGAKYGDLPAWLALQAPGALWMAGESRVAAAPVITAYRAAGAPKALTISAVGGDRVERVAAAWLASGGGTRLSRR
jgi:dienelactone hydrolase